jgi:hypothetical protein
LNVFVLDVDAETASLNKFTATSPGVLPIILTEVRGGRGCRGESSDHLIGSSNCPLLETEVPSFESKGVKISVEVLLLERSEFGE